MMSQQKKAIIRIIAIIIVLLAIGMRLQFIIIPIFSGCPFWFVVGGFILLLIAS